ncbi:MAG TPA: hypothetical protein VHE36_13705 [Sphingomicrobium sp.]|jgi:hypothetical protein|nr:hypothetical protein [Sphingomicrobium sp.]
MAKDKKKKKDKKAAASKATGGLKALAKNPLAADIVAAALVATASALKDSRRARALASEVGDELSKLSKEGTRQGEALWDMALKIGRRSLEALTSDDASKSANAKPKPAAKPKAKAAAKPKAKAAPKPRGKPASKPKAAAGKTSKKKPSSRAARK